MTETRQFSVGAVISAGTGRLACDMGELYDILDWLLKDSLMTHQLPGAARTAKPFLHEQFPWLAGLNLPEGGGADFTDAVMAATESYGPKVDVPRMPNPMWKVANALQDLADIAGSRPIIAFPLGGEDTR